MSSAFSAPFIVRPDATSDRLVRVPLSGNESTDAYSEAWLQDLLYRHPDSLPIAEIDGSFVDMVPVCREMETPAGPLDVLYVTPSGRLVIVEAKLWRNPEARRKVIGQILDYAKELSRWSYETLDASVRRARRMEDGAQQKSLAEVMGIRPDSPDAGRFFDTVTQSLRRGDFLLMIVGDGIREGVGAITEFLDGHASLHFTFGLVEMAIFRLPDGSQLVQPRVLAQSTIFKRIVVDLRHGSMEVSDEGGEVAQEEDAGPRPELVANREKFRTFWSGFLEKLELDDQSQPIGAPAKSTNQYFYMPKGSDSWVSAYLSPAANRAGVYLTFSKGPIGDRVYAALKDDKEEIERQLGIPVEWNTDGNRHYVTSADNYSGSLIDDHTDELHATMCDRVNRFINVFRPRLAKLVEAAV
jgi:hypothetical protein